MLHIFHHWCDLYFRKCAVYTWEIVFWSHSKKRKNAPNELWSKSGKLKWKAPRWVTNEMVSHYSDILGQSWWRKAACDPCLDRVVEPLHPLSLPTWGKPGNTGATFINWCQVITFFFFLSLFEFEIWTESVTLIYNFVAVLPSTL